jgi:hypothetical protein
MSAEQDQANPPAPPPVEQPPTLGQVARTALRKAILSGLLSGLFLGVLAVLATIYLSLGRVDDWLGQWIGPERAAVVWFVLRVALFGFVLGAVLEFLVQGAVGVYRSRRKAPPT